MPILSRIHDETTLWIESISDELFVYRAQLQETLTEKEEARQWINRLEEELDSEVVERFSAIEEKELLLSQYIEWRSMVTLLGVATNWAVDRLTNVYSMTSEMSWGVADLVTHLHPHWPGQSEDMQAFSKDLLQVS